ncbi:DNA-directed RNA polymerase III subunit Rpc5 [Mrakia frigida]|uniref:DNA-directed RNA polymerase III subunit C37 n=1 Tax=Mrakia frigida TaxID=29902 RepID=UPI003FCBF4D5
MGSDEEDQVMHEIPIFLSQKLSPNLHLFQYPVTDRIAVPESALNKGHKINARWKPLSKRFELEMPLDDRLDVYDPEKGEEFAEGARLQLEKETPTPTGSTAAARKKEDRRKEKERDERKRAGLEGNDGPKKALQSMKLKSEVVPDQTTYMAGSMRDGNLYLHPINLQLQLRPNLDYLDALDERNRDEKRRERAGGEDSEEEAEAGPGAAPKKEEGKTISVTHKKTEGESKYGAASSSSALRQEFLQRMQSEVEEPWVKLGWSEMESDKAQNVLDGLFDVPSEVLECTTKPLDFLNEASIGA